MMTYNIKAILEHYKEIFRGKVITRIGDIRCPGNTLVYYPAAVEKQQGHPAPTTNNDMDDLFLYLNSIKVHESGLGAELQQYDDDFQDFSNAIDNFKIENIFKK